MSGEGLPSNEGATYDSNTTRQEIHNFFTGAEFGSTRFTALSDYLNVRQARTTVETYRGKQKLFEERAATGTLDEQERDIARAVDSELRIQETQCANFLTRVQVNKDTLPGYEQDYDNLGGLVSGYEAALVMQHPHVGTPAAKDQAAAGVVNELRQLRRSKLPPATKS